MITETVTDLIAPNAADAANSLREDQKIAGCYILKKQIAASEGERVWLAQDEVLGKDVTLHFAPAALLRDPRATAELRSEVKRNRQLIHPNIVRVYDFVEDGVHAAVSMDYYEGDSLAATLRATGPMQPSAALPLLKEIAATLDDAHRVQLIHRDLSPENVFVRPSGGILIKGFGVSRVVRDALERAGVAKGDATHAAYMSPQLFDGTRAEAADDVYGFGALIFEMLTGAPPFQGDNLVQQIRKNVAPAISEARIASGAGANVPVSWEETVALCLAKSPANRPRNCTEAVVRLTLDGAVAPAPAPVAVEAKGDAQSKPAEAPKAVEALASFHRESAPTKGSPPPDGPAAAKGEEQLPPTVPVPGAKLPPSARSMAENFPDLERPKSKLPVVVLGLAAVALGFAVVSKFMGDPEVPVDPDIDRIASGESSDANATNSGTGTGGVAPTEPDGSGTPVTPVDPAVNTPPDVPSDLASAGGSESADPTAGHSQPGTIGTESSSGPAPKPRIIGAPQPPPEPKTPEPKAPELEPVAGAADPKNADPKPDEPKPAEPVDAVPVAKVPASAVVMPLPPVPEPPAKLTIPKDAKEEDIDRLIVERKAAYDKLRQIAAAIEVANEENSTARKAKKAEADEAAKVSADKRKALASIIQQAAAAEAERKKLEEAKAKAEAAALDAVKAAEMAKKAHEDFVTSAAEKLTAKEKAEVELSSMDAKLAAAKLAQEQLDAVVSKGDAELEKLQASLKRSDEDQKALKAAYDGARAAEAAKMAAMRKAKIAEIEEQAKAIEVQRARYATALLALKDLPEMAESAKKMEAKIAEADEQLAALQTEIKNLGSGPRITAPDPDAKKPVLPQGDPKKKTGAAEADPAVEPAGTVAAPSSNANSLGMEFVEVGGVSFARTVTTRGQFVFFSKAVGLKPAAWRNPGFVQGETHPVVNVSWREAVEFCKWLTSKERKEGRLKSNEVYRLPTDLEWSRAVGLPKEAGATPEERDIGIDNVYPWGSEWPPPPGAGNFAGEETETELPIRGYNDGFPTTSPVGSFKPNAAGLYDMGGNVWQWVEDAWDKKGVERTLRGGSWYNGAISMTLLSSGRIKSLPDTINDTYGFRIVKATVADRDKN